jgi:prophage antirepressor-like protein
MITEFHNVKYGRLRGSLIDDTPYLCLTDVARMLGVSNSHLCRTKIPDKDIVKLEVGKSKHTRLFVNAKHISSCIFKSTLKDAEKISDWIYKTVLPKLMNIFDEVEHYNDLYNILEFIDEFNQLKRKNTILETEMKLTKPKLKYIDKLIGSSKVFDLESAPFLLRYPGLSVADLYKTLRTKNVIDDNNRPYQEYCDKKYFRVVVSTYAEKGTKVSNHRTYVYKSGLAFIEKLLKENEVEKI